MTTPFQSYTTNLLICTNRSLYPRYATPTSTLSLSNRTTGHISCSFSVPEGIIAEHRCSIAWHLYCMAWHLITLHGCLRSFMVPILQFMFNMAISLSHISHFRISKSAIDHSHRQRNTRIVRLRKKEERYQRIVKRMSVFAEQQSNFPPSNH